MSKFIIKDWAGNKTNICSPCGVQEGIDDFLHTPLMQYELTK